MLLISFSYEIWISLYFSTYLSLQTTQTARRWSLHACCLQTLHNVLIRYKRSFFCLCRSPARFFVQTWHRHFTADILGPSSSSLRFSFWSLSFLPIDSSIFCLIAQDSPFRLRFSIRGVTNLQHKLVSMFKWILFAWVNFPFQRECCRRIDSCHIKNVTESGDCPFSGFRFAGIKTHPLIYFICTAFCEVINYK